MAPLPSRLRMDQLVLVRVFVACQDGMLCDRPFDPVRGVSDMSTVVRSKLSGLFSLETAVESGQRRFR